MVKKKIKKVNLNVIRKQIDAVDKSILRSPITFINENLFFTLCNIVEQDNKYLIVTSESSIVNIDFKLNDLKSRSKNFLLQNIEKPDDELIFALILKNNLHLSQLFFYQLEF